MNGDRIYTTKTGVQIGLLYRRPAPEMSRDAIKLQTALLSPKASKTERFVCRLIRPVWGWL